MKSSMSARAWKFATLAGAVTVLTLSVNAGTSGTKAAPKEVRAMQPRATVTQLYQQNCLNCHGPSGEGGGAGTKTFLTREKYAQELDKPYFDAIKKGVPDMAMPSYGEAMSDEQIWGLVVLIREMQGRALRREFGSPKAVNGVYRSQRHNFKVETVVDTGKGLKTPWGIDWLPTGEMLVTNRPGGVVVVKNGNVMPLNGVPASLELGQGGMMEVSVHPKFRENGWVYLAYTEPAASGRGGNTKIVRGRVRVTATAATWSEQKTIWQSGPEFYTGAGVHFGSRIVFDGKGHLFFVVGERGGNMMAQELTNPFGKIYRVKDDGTIPTDNPFYSRVPADKPYLRAIWSLGHRNPQGLVMTPKGELWATEHGPRGGDELNLITKGANYGWPVVAFSINYNEIPQWTPWPAAGQNISMPTWRWMPSIGASGLDVARGRAFPNWNGDLLAGGLSGANLDRIRTNGSKLVEREELLHGMGRVREVATGPDGNIYVALNGPDKIIRLVPAP